MNSNITTFIFDCFGVVCTPVLNGWYKFNSVKHGFVDENLKELFRQFDLGILSEDDIVSRFLNYKGISSTREHLRDEIDGYLKLDQNLVQVIKILKLKNFKTALLSNGNTSFFERKIYTSYPEFKTIFDEIVISSEVKMVKPDPAIYALTLQKLGSKAEETIFIDDVQENLDTAVRLGMKGFLYTDFKSFAKYLRALELT